MLGIDIVDLKDPALKERNKRSLDLIKNDKDVYTDHPYLFWLLWSAKEAAFKYHREPINFAPTNIPIEININEKDIHFKSNNLSGKIIVEEEYIVAICGDLDEIDYHVFEKKDKDWSSGIRKMIVDFFTSKGKEYTVGADELNLPLVEPVKSKISISHHGRYGAMAFSKSLI